MGGEVGNLLYGGIRYLYFGIGGSVRKLDGTIAGPYRPRWRMGQRESTRLGAVLSTARGLGTFCTGSSKFLSHPHQVSQRPGLHLFHHLTPVQLDRDFADAQLERNLLVQ